MTKKLLTGMLSLNINKKNLLEAVSSLDCQLKDIFPHLKILHRRVCVMEDRFSETGMSLACSETLDTFSHT